MICNRCKVLLGSLSKDDEGNGRYLRGEDRRAEEQSVLPWHLQARWQESPLVLCVRTLLQAVPDKLQISGEMSVQVMSPNPKREWRLFAGKKLTAEVQRMLVWRAIQDGSCSDSRGQLVNVSLKRHLELRRVWGCSSSTLWIERLCLWREGESVKVISVVKERYGVSSWDCA